MLCLKYTRKKKRPPRKWNENNNAEKIALSFLLNALDFEAPYLNTSNTKIIQLFGKHFEMRA